MTSPLIPLLTIPTGFLKAKTSFLFSIASHAAFLALTWLFW